MGSSGGEVVVNLGAGSELHVSEGCDLLAGITVPGSTAPERPNEPQDRGHIPYPSISYKNANQCGIWTINPFEGHLVLKVERYNSPGGLL